MSTTNRSTQRERDRDRPTKTSKMDACNLPNKLHKTDSVKTETTKALDKVQPTAEQMRIAQIIDTKTEDPMFKDKIKQVMDATQKSEDEVCTALHDCDNDANSAVNFLLEGVQSEWSTSIKKKKNRAVSASKGEKGGETVGGNAEGAGEDWDSPGGGGETGTVTMGSGGNKERGGGPPDRGPRQQRGGGPPRMRGRGALESRGWRGRENKENERNLEGGLDRGRRGGRGGGRGGGRTGPRTFHKGPQDGGPPSRYNRSIETWNNPAAHRDKMAVQSKADDFPSAEDWDNDDYTGLPPKEKKGNWDDFPSPEDWDNEEYTGSLADTKVFTPSSGPEPSQPAQPPSPSPPSPHPATNALHEPPLHRPPSPVGPLTPAQSQYLSQLTALSQTESLKNAVGLTKTASRTPQPIIYSSSPVTYSSVSYGNSYGSPLPDVTSGTQQVGGLPARAKLPRPRVPPPSKIPSSAVEMPPGDAVGSGIGFLDVQFGGLDFGTEATGLDVAAVNSSSSVVALPPVSLAQPPDSPSPPPPATVTPSPAPAPSPTPLRPSLPPPQQPQDHVYANHNSAAATITSSMSLSQSHKLTSGESLLEQGAYSGTNTKESPQQQLAYSSSSAAESSSSMYQSQSPEQVRATTSYKAATQGYHNSYNVTSYSTPQVTSNSTYNASYTSGGYSSASNNTYPATGYNASAQQQHYPAAAYPAAVPQYSYAASGAAQQPAATNQYSNPYQYQQQPAQQNHKPAKDMQYESNNVGGGQGSSPMNSSSIVASTTANVTPSLGLSAASQAVATTKLTTMSTTGGSKQSGVVPNMPPGVAAPMMGTQYIMSQGAMPYFTQQPALYSFEDMQMLQQRIQPHMAATGYYDLGSFQAPTSLAGGREAGLANVAYSMSDGRFARADNNASPVPSNLTQQSSTAAHQQPMINPPLPPGYAYYYNTSMLPGSFPYTAPALYPVAATGAAGGHGSTAGSGGYGKAPTGYGSGYGSGYEVSTTGGGTQEYKVGGGGYSGSLNQNKGANSGGPNAPANSQTTPADLTSNMYNKSHAALAKVNSYENKGFHSGTPPPFNLATSQTATGMAPSGAYTPHGVYIPTINPHQQHHSTALMHQPLHQDAGNNSGARSQATSQPNKTGAKQNYSPSNYWAPN